MAERTLTSKRRELMRLLQKEGLTKVAAAGVVGNLQQESSLNPYEPGGGLAQWLGSRYHGPENMSQSVRHIMSELRSEPSYGLSQLQRAKSPQQAASIFAENFERPAKGPTENLSGREQYAAEAFHAAGGHVTSEPVAEQGVEGQATNTGVLNHVPFVGGYLEGIKNAGEGFVQFFQIITSVETWLRIGEGIGGMVIIYLGVKTLTQGSAAKPEIKIGLLGAGQTYGVYQAGRKSGKKQAAAAPAAKPARTVPGTKGSSRTEQWAAAQQAGRAAKAKPKPSLAQRFQHGAKEAVKYEPIK